MYCLGGLGGDVTLEGKALERPINIVLIFMYGTLKCIIRGLICMIHSIKRPKHGA